MKEQLRQRLLQVFQAEHAEHLGAIRQWIDEPAETADEGLNEAFRRAHSLKGAARAVDLAEVESLAHHLETLFARVRAGQLSLDASAIRHVHQLLDLSENWMQALAQQQPPPSVVETLQAFEEWLGLEPTAPAVAAPSSPEPSPAAVEPTVPAPEAGTYLLGEQLRISGARLEGLLENADRLQAEAQCQREIEKNCRHLLEQLQQLSSHLPPDVLLLSQWQGLNALTQKISSQQRQSSWRLAQEVQLLQRSVRNVRMLPVRELFQIFPKMLRELAHEQGKEVMCRFSGLDTEADRAVLQAIKDPVMHILRNAVAHGIEKPAQREALGKDPVGLIECRVTVKGHQLQICISDDGRGLDQARILSKLQEHNPELDALPPQWQQAIFQPGFSTARGVTALRGRGMGLSVVAHTLARLQGAYRVVAQQGPGMTLELEVPLHIATYHVLLLTVEKQRFAIPSSAIGELLRRTPEDIQYHGGRALLALDSELLPFFTLGQILFQRSARPVGTFPVLVLEVNETRVALAVESLLHDADSVLKPLSGPASALSLYLGAVLAADGLPVPVLDPFKLLEQTRQGTTPLQLAPEGPVKLPPLILVVDDSITTRTLEQGILETQGFRVRVAVNGLEALQELRSQRFDLVLTDVQMPEMDGLELVAAMKAEQALADIPVIMVTSLYADADRQRGLQLGADAYLVKQKFEQQELLDVIEQLL
ncbi:MAG: hybrid sensor histidine kinase/response regulator [Candidatus Sericytochromatia bacterium]